MARRRHQVGRIIVRGKNPPVFVGRWREDVIQGEQTIRVERSMVLGTVAELKTKRIAQRLLDPILAKINSFDYRPSKCITIGKFADTWESQVLVHQKPSSVKAAKSHLRTHIRKHLENALLHELTPQVQQNFVTLLSRKGVSRKTVLNVLGILSSMMGTAKSWGYCTQVITTSELALPAEEVRKQTRFFNGSQDHHRCTGAVPHDVRNCRDDRFACWRGCGAAESRPRLRPPRDSRPAIGLVRAGANGEEQGEPRTCGDVGGAFHAAERVSGDLEAESGRFSVPEPEWKALRREQGCRIRPLARPRQAGNRTCGNARIQALPREFADGSRSESDGRERADATLGCANHAGNLRSRDRRLSAECSGQSGRAPAARILRPDAPKLRWNGEQIHTLAERWTWVRFPSPAP
jgi:hypothetical protein